MPVAFSAKLAVVPLLKAGASFTLVTVIATFRLLALPIASVAETMMSYTLFVPASPGDSKFGLALNVTAPLVLLILNRPASVPLKL